MLVEHLLTFLILLAIIMYYANIVASGSTLCKLSSIVALQNRYFILQKMLIEFLFCENLFYFFFSFWQNNLRILRVKLPHMVAVKQIANPILNRSTNCILISSIICKVTRFFPLLFASFYPSKTLRRGM